MFEGCGGLRGPPVEGAAAQAVDVGALGASVAGDAPQVLVQSVGTGDLTVPLSALLSALLDSGGGSGRGHAQHDGSSSKELHVAGGEKDLSVKESRSRIEGMVYKDSTSLTLVRDKKKICFCCRMWKKRLYHQYLGLAYI